MNLSKNLKKEIVSRITDNLKVKEIILFGSYVYGKAREESDLDLVVILDQRGMAKSWMERVNNRNKVSQLFLDREKYIPMDILVFTIDEWELLSNSDISFYNEINQKGVRLI